MNLVLAIIVDSFDQQAKAKVSEEEDEDKEDMSQSMVSSKRDISQVVKAKSSADHILIQENNNESQIKPEQPVMQDIDSRNIGADASKSGASSLPNIGSQRSQIKAQEAAIAIAEQEKKGLDN